MGKRGGRKARGGRRGAGHGRGVGRDELFVEEMEDNVSGFPEASRVEVPTSRRSNRRTGGPGSGSDHGTGSIGEPAMARRSAQQTLPPPLNTRAANKNSHPGAIVAPATRRSSEVVQAERLRLEELRAAAENHQSAAISRVAELEDQMALQDKEKSTYAHRPRIPPGLPPRTTHKRPQASTQPSEDCEYDDDGLY